MNNLYGKYHDVDSTWKFSSKDPYENYKNSLTRRNKQLVERTPSRLSSTSLASAGLKSLRLYRHCCRLIPYILKIHEIQHRTTPEQSKIYLGNHFRANAHLTDVDRIDWLVDIGYELLHDAEWQFTNTGYLYKYFMAPNGVLNDHGRDRFDQYRAEKLNRKAPASSFLKGFYRGHKSHEL